MNRVHRHQERPLRRQLTNCQVQSNFLELFSLFFRRLKLMAA